MYLGDFRLRKGLFLGDYFWGASDSIVETVARLHLGVRLWFNWFFI
jgi:hypothetical protein